MRKDGRKGKEIRNGGMKNDKGMRDFREKRRVRKEGKEGKGEMKGGRKCGMERGEGAAIHHPKN